MLGVGGQWDSWEKEGGLSPPKAPVGSTVAANPESKVEIWVPRYLTQVHLWMPPILENQGGMNQKIFLCCFKVVVTTTKRNALKRFQKYSA